MLYRLVQFVIDVDSFVEEARSILVEPLPELLLDATEHAWQVYRRHMKFHTLPSSTGCDANGIGTFYLPSYSSVPSALSLTSWTHQSRPRQPVQHIYILVSDKRVKNSNEI